MHYKTNTTSIYSLTIQEMYYSTNITNTLVLELKQMYSYHMTLTQKVCLQLTIIGRN